MAGLFEARGTQFYNGKYYESYPTIENAETGIFFTYERYEDERNNFTQPINNLVTREKRLSICTTSPICWRVGAYVLTQDGRMWTIEDWREDPVINPQAAFFIKRNLECAVLSLVEVDNPLGLRV